MSALYIVRHGTYDRQELTEGGREEVRQTAQAIRNDLNGTSLITIYHSPLARARESALIIQRALAPIGATLEERTELSAEEEKIDQLDAEIQRPAIIVAHEPAIKAYLRQIRHDLSTLQPGRFVKIP